MYYEKILADKLRLEREIADVKKELSHLPCTKLICTRNGNRYKWYESDGHNLTYIPKCQRRHAQELARRRYLEEQVVYLQREKRALEHYLSDFQKEFPCFQYKVLEHPEFFKLLSPYFKPVSEKLSLWAEEEYEANPYHPENCIVETLRGIKVRSKSEAMIAMALDQYKIPYRYEDSLKLGDSVVYPDFTLRHPVTGDYFYWEHFGMMDDEKYTVSASRKISQYAMCGIVPSVQLLMTFETMSQPLRLDYVKNMIEFYFS